MELLMTSLVGALGFVIGLACRGKTEGVSVTARRVSVIVGQCEGCGANTYQTSRYPDLCNSCDDAADNSNIGEAPGQWGG